MNTFKIQGNSTPQHVPAGKQTFTSINKHEESGSNAAWRWVRVSKQDQLHFTWQRRTQTCIFKIDYILPSAREQPLVLNVFFATKPHFFGNATNWASGKSRENPKSC